MAYSLRPGQHELDRPPDDPRCRGGQQLVRPDPALAAEAAAVCCAITRTFVGWQAEARGEDVLHAIDVLGGIVDRQAIAVPRGEDRRRLHGL